MPTYQFYCSHCNQKFEAETPEVKECPFCFWASSVKREDALRAEKKQTRTLKGKAPLKSVPMPALSIWWHLLKIVLWVVFLSGLVYLGYQIYLKWAAFRDEGGKPFSVTSQDVERIEADQKQVEASFAELLPQERGALYGEVVLDEDVEPGPTEKEILDRTVEFKTGWSEKLPSTMWTLEQYKKLIADQESLYRITFARSYRKKLVELFETNYLPATEAFKEGDLLKARDLFVASLAFPLYSKDIMKHRAVALTMLKPFINDTLAKISSLNQALIIKEKRQQEEALTMAYQNLMELIAQKKWEEATQAIDAMKPAIDQLEIASKEKTAPPPYSPAIAMVDQDIQRALADLLAPTPVSTANLLGLRQDLAEKKDILIMLNGKQLEAVQVTYQNALAMIRQEQWRDALTTLKALHGPEVLKKDAQTKIIILEKILGEGTRPAS
jgi:hypothetical protein